MFFWSRIMGKKITEMPASEVLSASVRASDPVEPNRPKPIKVIIVNIAVFSVIVGSLGTAAYFYGESRRVSQRLTPQGELEAVVTALSKIVELPQGEIPTLATVSDKSKLTEQSFFARAENGDKALLYQNAREAYLYRPSTGKLVNVAPINVRDETPATPESQSNATQPLAAESVAGVQTENPPIASVPPVAEAVQSTSMKAQAVLYNGTEKVGITHDFEKDFLDSNSSIEVVAKEPAAKKDYQHTIVVDLSRKYSSLALSIAEEAGTSVESLPEGEVAPEGADILVIIGRDRV